MEVHQDVLQVALAKAITESVPAEMQKEIFAKAMHEHLFRSGRNGERSPVSEAFQRALDEATRELARKIVFEPENAAKLKVAIQTALDAAFTEGLVDKVTRKFTHSFF